MYFVYSEYAKNERFVHNLPGESGFRGSLYTHLFSRTSISPDEVDSAASSGEMVKSLKKRNAIVVKIGNSQKKFRNMIETNKIIRSLCYFSKNPNIKTLQRLDALCQKLQDFGFLIQTQRICTTDMLIRDLDNIYDDPSLYLSVGTLTRNDATQQLKDFIKADNVAFNLGLNEDVLRGDVNLLFEIIREKAEKTFSFTYTFQNAEASPYFPSASYVRDGFAIGFQPTDLGENCSTIQQWLQNIKTVWNTIMDLFRDERDFLGIDSSIAPLFTGKSSLIHFIKKISGDFGKAVTTDIFLKISQFIKIENPKPIGLCGIMFPCLEDFELAKEYEKGRFSIERNMFLALHSGLGIDTYPVGIDEEPQRIMEILLLLSGFANKYHKPLSARFVSDGISKIGEKSSFKNQYLKDVVIRKL